MVIKKAIKDWLFKRRYYIFLIVISLNLVSLIFFNGPIWGALCYLLYFIIIVWIFYLICKFSREYLSKYIKNKWKRFAIMYLILCLILLTLVPYISTMEHIRAEANKPLLKSIVGDLIIGAESDEERTLAVLEWFNLSNDNIYNDYHLSVKGVPNYPLLGDFLKIYLGPPYIGIRIVNDEDSLWILTSRYGHCGEYGLLFRDMANEAGLNVRRIRCAGEDHVWNEVMIDGEWVIIDSTRVGSSEDNGYNVSSDFMEKKVAGNRNLPNGNVSYVTSDYLNGTEVDVTSRYTTITNITIYTNGSKGNPLENIQLNIISYNRFGDDTDFSCKTNNDGYCNFSFGGGEYLIEARTNDFIPLYGSVLVEFSEDTPNHTVDIELTRDWTKNDFLLWGLLLLSIGLMAFGLANIVKTLRNKFRKK